MDNWYLYRHIRLDKHEPFYIGIGKVDNFKRAYSLKSRNKIWKSITQKTNYEVEVIFDNLSKEDCVKKEKEFIKLYGRKNSGGMLANQSDGGEGIIGRENIETWKENLKKSYNSLNTDRKNQINDKIREKLKGHIGYMKGKKLTEEQKEKIRKAKKGKKMSEETKLKLREINLGKKMSEETKQKIKDWQKNIGFTKEQKEKMSKAASFKRTLATKIKMSESAKNKKKNVK
jgi:hypothetical protein